MFSPFSEIWNNFIFSIFDDVFFFGPLFSWGGGVYTIPANCNDFDFFQFWQELFSSIFNKFNQEFNKLGCFSIQLKRHIMRKWAIFWKYGIVSFGKLKFHICNHMLQGGKMPFGQKTMIFNHFEIRRIQNVRKFI